MLSFPTIIRGNVMDCTNLKIGDKVAVTYHGCGSSSVYFRTVEKVNKKTIKVDGRLFYKDNGRQQGERWNSLYLDTVENGLKLKAEIEQTRKLNKANVAIEKLGLKPSTELVNELLSIIDRYK